MRFTEKTLRASRFAIQWHDATNHLYDGSPYVIHLSEVVGVAFQFIHLVAAEDRDTVISACWLHDVIEDCRVTYNDLKKQFGEDVTELVYAVSTEKGKTRSERANEKYYEGIRDIPYATFIKLCDRIANTRYSAIMKSGMLKTYISEYDKFRASLFIGMYKEMFDHLEYTMSKAKQIQP